jgi:hypothetical protein
LVASQRCFEILEQAATKMRLAVSSSSSSLSRIEWLWCLIMMMCSLSCCPLGPPRPRIPFVVDGFSMPTTTPTRSTRRRGEQRRRQQQQLSSLMIVVSSSRGNNQDNNKNDQDQKLAQLGISKEELQRSRRRPGDDDSDQSQPSVRVDLIEDVDPLSLTAVGFGLIAVNFFILANLGDGGIAGMVARIINAMNE